MNYDEVINRLIKHISPLRDMESTYNNEAIDLAIVAVRAQQEREDTNPLTLEELKERDGKPVYITGLVYEGIDRTKITGWFIRDKQDVYTDYKSSYFRASYWNTVMKFCDDDYGCAWVAYDYEPKGAVK